MKQFEIGKTYATASICDHECIFSYTVEKRTASTVTLVTKFGERKLCRISKKFSAYCGCEVILPEGQYSMCPIIHATDAVA